jgi:hypothetical protein
MDDRPELNKYITKIWQDYCDLDYWIDDMDKGGNDRIPKNVLKMAMKHLRTDLYGVHALLCRLEISNDEMLQDHLESTRDNNDD